MGILSGAAYHGRLAQIDADSSDSLVWSDGEVWIRGFDKFAGLWYSHDADSASEPVAEIFNSGLLVWRVSFKAHNSWLQLRRRPDVRLELRIDSTTHTGILVDQPDGAELQWSDGEVWRRSP